ncbi:MAG: fatty acid cis/trans isomerase [Myxococcota bacterium]
MARTRIAVVVSLAAALAIGACARIALRPPVAVDPLPRTVSFRGEVQPLLDRRCVVCHSCYNAPCQLKLGSYEGTDRGASKLRVYDSARLDNQAPTRLFFDAHTTADWRSKGFFSVTSSTAARPLNDSTMLQLLEAKRQHPEVRGSYHPEADDLTCAADSRELSRFLHRHPERGMPFGFPALEPAEHALLATWLEQGAPGPTADELAALTAPSPAAASRIGKWEAFLNQEDAKHTMTARYLYEHFFLAHLVFSDVDPSQFFELVRSTTPPGEPIDVIATVRPYDPPPVERFFYRFRRLHETLVHKTHMVVEFTDETYDRYQELFIDVPWLEPPYVVPLDDDSGANAFLVYAQIPTQSRYRFMLDHSKYFIQSFMQGPVCKGQVALNVIRDHFWVLFLDPDADQGVLRPRFLIEQAQNLRLPNEEGSRVGLLKAFSDDYRERYARFYHAKMALYETVQPRGFGIDSIWRGRRPGDRPALTVYRHFDSASVHDGLVGDLPRTAWVIDYAHFERIYYALVAGFDVFGNVSHQINVRRYMDYLRMEGELNFLHFLPPDDRFPMLQSWYIGDGALEDANPDQVVSTEFGTRVGFETRDPKRELFEQLVAGHLNPAIGVAFDRINYRPAGMPDPTMPETFETREDIRNGFRSLTAPGTALIRHHNDTGVNLFFMRFRGERGREHFVSAVINRWHDNVSSMFGEAQTLDPSKDTIDFIEGSVGSYPNVFFVVDVEDIGDFFDMMANYDGSPEYVKKLRRFSVNRGDTEFWDTYDWFQRWLDENEPMNAGLYDLNRYYAEASDTPR